MLILKLFQVVKTSMKRFRCVVAEARLKELKNWKINKVHDEVDDDKKKLILVKWVLTK